MNSNCVRFPFCNRCDIAHRCQTCASVISNCNAANFEKQHAGRPARGKPQVTINRHSAGPSISGYSTPIPLSRPRPWPSNLANSCVSPGRGVRRTGPGSLLGRFACNFNTDKRAKSSAISPYSNPACADSRREPRSAASGLRPRLDGMRLKT